MMQKFSTSVCLFAAVLLVSCAEDGSPILEPMPEADTPNAALDQGASDGSDVSSPAPGSDPSNGPQALTQYNGSYLQGCSTNSTIEAYATVVVSIQDDTLILSEQGYGDAACAEPASLLQTSYSLVYPGGTTDTSRGAADHVDITLEGVILNSETLSPEQLQQLDASGAFNTVHNLFLLDGASLYTGLITEEFDGTSAASRPVDLALNVAVRQ